jgi:hypothetical protein
MGDSQPQSGAFADLFGGKIGAENSLPYIPDSQTIISLRLTNCDLLFRLANLTFSRQFQVRSIHG